VSAFRAGFAGTGEPTFCCRFVVVVGDLPFGIFLGTMSLENCFFIACYPAEG
jgi:hypothetical protein